jgi:membrane protein
VLKRAARGFWEDDSFILAGHLAYLSLLTIFPFLLLLFKLAGSFGRTEEGLDAATAFLDAMPPNVAAVLAGPINQVLTAGSGGVLTLGIFVAIWTAGSFIETNRVVLHKAYDHSAGRPVWQYRLQSVFMVLVSAVLLLLAISAQLALAGAWQLVAAYIPRGYAILEPLAFLRDLITPAILFLAIYGLYLTLTPGRHRTARHWPGALVAVAMWISTAFLLPTAIAAFGTYDLTYGSLAGVMVTLLFFYVIGLGFVLGAQVNAAIDAEFPRTRRTMDMVLPHMQAKD